MKKVVLVGILYLLWQFVGGVELVQADGRHHYQPPRRVYIPVPVPVYRYPRPIYVPAPVYFPRPRTQIIVRERVVIVDRPVVVEREAPVSQPAPLASQPEPNQPEFQGQIGNGPVRCSDEQLRQGKAQYGTNGWLQDLDTGKRCYYDLTKPQY